MIRAAAPAKVNLFLEITGKRFDGYHRLATLFQTISLSDELGFAAAPELSLRCSDRSLPTDERNLAMRAAVRLREALKETRGARISLIKRVPMGAGLGGGSSDAAAVLWGLLKLWKRKIASRALHRLAADLGADVPFFLEKGLCAATGIGDRLRPLPALPKTWIVLVYPGFGVPTKDAYAGVRLPFGDPRRMNARQPLQNLFNRFESVVFPGRPALPALKDAILAAGATAALMSGSGSSVFGLAPSEAAGRRILRRLRPTYPQSWLVHTI